MSLVKALISTSQHQKFPDGSQTLAGKMLIKAAYRIEELEKAIKDIADPLLAIQEQAKINGDEINPVMAVQLANDPNHLKQIAKNAISAK